MIVKTSGTHFSLCFSFTSRIDKINKLERPLSDYFVNESCKSCLVFRKRKYRPKSVFPWKKSRPRLLSERLSGVLLGLTRGCDLRKEGVTVTTQDNNPDNRFDS